jgi:hypothetical protein
MLALGVGLFGLRWLSGSEHADLRRALTPKSSSGDGWDFSPSCGGGGSCGGSGCGGGGCGGGGCGGGGCGGCGGG